MMRSSKSTNKYVVYIMVIIVQMFNFTISTLGAGLKRQHSWDLNKTASSGGGGITGNEGGEEEVQSAPPIRSEQAHQDDHINSNGWGNKRQRTARQPKQGPIQFVIVKKSKGRPKTKSLKDLSRNTNEKQDHHGLPLTTITGKPLSGKLENGECETHRAGCEHWEGLSAKEKNTNSARLSRRRRFHIPEYRRKMTAYYSSWYHGLSKEERYKVNKRRYQRHRELIGSLPIEKQKEDKERHNRNCNNSKKRRKAKLASIQEDSGC